MGTDGSLCCIPETITTFLINYTPYKIKSFLKMEAVKVF